MKSEIRLCLNSVGGLCRDTDPDAAQLIAPIGDDVPSEHQDAYLALMDIDAPEDENLDAPEKVVPVENVGELVLVGGRWGIAGEKGPKWLSAVNAVDLRSIAAALGLESEGTKAELVAAIEAKASE